MQEHVNKERKRWYTIYIVDKRGKETKRITKCQNNYAYVFIFNFPLSLSLWSQVNFLFLEGGTDREGGIGARVGCRFHIPPWLSSSIVMLELLSKQVFLLLPLNGLLFSCWPFIF